MPTVEARGRDRQHHHGDSHGDVAPCERAWSFRSSRSKVGLPGLLRELVARLPAPRAPPRCYRCGFPAVHNDLVRVFERSNGIKTSTYTSATQQVPARNGGMIKRLFATTAENAASARSWLLSRRRGALRAVRGARLGTGFYRAILGLLDPASRLGSTAARLSNVEGRVTINDGAIPSRSEPSASAARQSTRRSTTKPATGTARTIPAAAAHARRFRY